VVTHDVEGALGFADRVALLHSGKLQFLGTAQAFRSSTNPLVRAFADRQAAAEMAAREAGRAEPVAAPAVQGVQR
jgi:ABC-type transporter Mla maintaining outer membrane lipid asymmetry ATPase subunit MlaF